MALRLRKDVQKASYYVWFLGAEEARGLRGPRVLLPAIPHLIERSREQEPLKVTLQVSHKGMKIVQGSSKHFITHSAITCSVQAEDIVACVLLLYNPTTKCPLHVHAYRCDSETTAQALHQFLQVLINRPENQKRFAELEARLGLQSQVTSPSNRSSPPKIAPKRTETSPRRFESSLGSDTGTSRESECSEELSPTSPTVPIASNKANLYDSLAAELRAKLNGNGPPLLLPPRDYDTVHRSKGNLAATELRRCRNSLIVGANGPKQITPSRSRGSSGIGSDLAPSPERQDGHSSSDDEWVQNQRENHSILPPPAPITRPIQHRTYLPDRSPANHLNDNNNQPPSYLYPRDQKTPSRSANNQYKSNDQNRSNRSANREEPIRPRSQSREEEKIKPIIIRPPNFESKFKNILDERRFGEEDDYPRAVPIGKFEQEKKRLDRTFRQAEGQEKRYFEKERSQDRYYRDDEPISDIQRYNDKKAEKENLTDKQKFRESLIEQQKSSRYRDRYSDQGQEYYQQQKTSQRQTHPEAFDNNKYTSKSKPKFENTDRNGYKGEATIERTNYRNKATDKKLARVYSEKSALGYDSHNSYKEADSLPYRDNMDRIVKSPVIRYNSFDESTFGDMMASDEHRSRERDAIFVQQEKIRQAARYHSGESPSRYPERDEFSVSRRRIIEQRDRSPETVLRISPKDRFHNAREKFQAIERERSYHDLGSHIRRTEPRRNSLERNGNVIVQHRYDNRKIDWSSDEEQHMSRRAVPTSYHDVDSFEPMPPSSRALGAAKSLGNLVKGYRHSYAEPIARQMPRNSGRVGLAAVNPF